MEIKTAINILKERKNCSVEPELLQALTLAIDALDREFPKMMKLEKDGNTVNCPNCGRFIYDISDEVVHGDDLRYRQGYCDDCGQGFDWGDINEIVDKIWSEQDDDNID